MHCEERLSLQVSRAAEGRYARRLLHVSTLGTGTRCEKTLLLQVAGLIGQHAVCLLHGSTPEPCRVSAISFCCFKSAAQLLKGDMPSAPSAAAQPLASAESQCLQCDETLIAPPGWQSCWRGVCPASPWLPHVMMTTHVKQAVHAES